MQGCGDIGSQACYLAAWLIMLGPGLVLPTFAPETAGRPLALPARNKKQHATAGLFTPSAANYYHNIAICFSAIRSSTKSFGDALYLQNYPKP